jgi:AcrR family transcriptional regulator
MSEDPLSRIARLTHDRAYAERVDSEWRQAIIDAANEGVKVADIAAAAEISRTRVYQIKRGE